MQNSSIWVVVASESSAAICRNTNGDSRLLQSLNNPKGDGAETRPIGIPTFEDKVLQRAVAMVIGEVYEQSFHDFSYGFRPGRSAHQMLQAIRNTAVHRAGGWIVEVDIRKFSTPSSTLTCRPSFADGYVTECCCA